LINVGPDLVLAVVVVVVSGFAVDGDLLEYSKIMEYLREKLPNVERVWNDASEVGSGLVQRLSRDSWRLSRNVWAKFGRG
jgi:hypothetical protein